MRHVSRNSPQHYMSRMGIRKIEPIKTKQAGAAMDTESS
jgi:hypothetical protein